MIFISIYKFITYKLHQITSDKPSGPYHSSVSIRESKINHSFLFKYTPSKNIYYSSDRKSNYKINEVWIEKNMNDPLTYQDVCNYKFIVNVNFKYITKNNLHKFRLIKNNLKTFYDYSEAEKLIEYPDGYPRIRYLVNQIDDTIKLEVIERNPNDSLNWMTEKVVDTIRFVKQ